MTNRISTGLGYGVAAGALWGGVFPALQSLSAFSAAEVTAGRFFAYGCMSLVLIAPLWRGLKGKIGWADIKRLLLLAALGNLVYQVFLAAAVDWVGVAPSALVVGILPITISIAGSRDAGAIGLRSLAEPLAMIGLGIVCMNFDLFSADSDPSRSLKVAGLACAFAALALWTLYAVGNARSLARRPSISSTEWSLLTGVASGALAIPLGAFALVYPSPAGPTRDWAVFAEVIIVMALGSSVLGNAFWNAASRLLPLTFVGQLVVFETLFGLLYGFLYAGRWPRPLEWAAIVLLPCGVLWSARQHARQHG
jgi:drug/metabolite transporter (DMT)-like permease